MTLKEFAASLNNREYGYPQFTKEEIQTAKDNGFVIVYGASDDLMEFEGAIHDEIGCFDGGEAYFDKNGTVSDEEFQGGNRIEAIWGDKENLDDRGEIIAWTYKTDIPHESFMIYDDGEPYCKAIVFRIDDIK